MKRVGFLTAVATAAALVLGLTEAADAAVRYVKSPSGNQNKQEDAAVRGGNVRRGGSVGNVRSSSRSERQPSSSSRRLADSTPTVTRSASTSSSARRSSSPSSVRSARSSSSRRYPSSSSTTRSTSTVSRTPRSSSSTGERLSNFSSRGRDIGTTTSGRTGYARGSSSTVGNVRRASDSGNVTYSYVSRRDPATPDSRRRRRHHDDDDNGITYPCFTDPNAQTDDECQCRRWHHYRRRHKPQPRCLPSPHIFIYRHGGTFTYVHSGKYGPHWYQGRWHPYRADCQRVIYYGYWIDTRDYYYVNSIEPPWVENDYAEPAVDGAGAVSDYEPGDAYRDFIRKGQIHDAVVADELSLSTTEARRVLVLIQRGIIRDVLNATSQRGQSDYDFDERGGLLTLTAPSEQIAIIETMVRDRRTFVAVTELNRYGNSAAVIPVASPFFLEEDFRGAVQLATDNLEALRRMLQERDWRYGYRDKECWLNAEYGTVTVVDDDEGIERALDLMKQRPFVPRELVHE